MRSRTAAGSGLALNRPLLDEELRAGLLEMLNSVVEVRDALGDVINLRGVLEPIVFAGSRDHVGRVGSEVLAGLALEALALVTAMIHARLAALDAEPVVDAIRQTLACVFDPRTAMKRPALGRASALGVLAIRATEPLFA